MSRKIYIEAELAELLLESSDDGDFSASESSFNPSEYEDNWEDDVFQEDIGEIHTDHASSESDTEMGVLENVEILQEVDNSEQGNACSVAWRNAKENDIFEPKFKVPSEKQVKILLDVPCKSSEFDYFRHFFPMSLLIRIDECTNKRIKILNRDKQTNRALTDQHEMLVFFGVSLVMHYNHLPTLADYWSKQPSMGNDLVKRSISRNRWTLLASKLYFNDVNKPSNAAKDYYISEVVACLKQTFIAARADSSFQSIEECMAKFKGRSSLKQYMPMKPIKRGVKILMRCDAKTGYTYDFNIYTGKDESVDQTGTLGERVVLSLTKTIRDENVFIAFDRFFSSLNLFKSIGYLAVGTYIRNRKNMQRKLIVHWPYQTTIA